MEKCLLVRFHWLKLYKNLSERTVLNTGVFCRFNSTVEDPKSNYKAHGTLLNVKNAKIKLDSLVSEISVKLQKDICLPKLITQRVEGSNKWKTTLSMGWPQDIVVEGVATNKSESEKVAFLQVCLKLKELGVVDENLSLCIKDESREMTADSLREAKISLSNVFSMVCQKYNSQNWRPMVQFTPVKGVTNQKIGWKAILKVKWPKNYTAEGVGKGKIDAERIAAFKTLEWLKSQGVVDNKNSPILYTENERKAFVASRRNPLLVSIPNASEQNMSEILKDYEKLRDNIEANIVSPKRYNSSIVESLIDKDEDDFEDFGGQETNEVSEMTKDGYSEMNSDEKARSHYLYENYVSRMRANDIDSLKIKEMQQSLPIYDNKEKILEMIRSNRVIVLSGEPGCGKTTQVPQFILDEFSSQNIGGVCKMVVTQPRRLSTINIAKLVAKQRAETIGQTIGYQVRLQSVPPPKNGSILFCSTGVLLQKLHSDPDLNNFSHVIVDEVHERDVQTDFLLVLLKDIIERNKNLKVALMSASLNSQMFSTYFHNSPIINVPGFMYPVKEHYLPDIVKKISKVNHYRDEMSVSPKQGMPRLNYDLVLDTIRYIDETQSAGAILCFLPGWQDIKAIQQRLNYLFGNSSRHLICTVHSSIPHNEQELIFNNPPPGVRKIILSTNIAETSITIDDVVYVIDPGFHKALSYDSNKGVARLGTEWISRANAKQRKGRAGRVKPGECYRLYTQEAHSLMDEFPIPDMMRTPLEKVVIDSKVFCPDMLCKELLAKAPQPPSKSAISRAVSDMTRLGVLDEYENLTLLGEKIACFSTHPRLAVALVVSSFLKCVESTLNIVSLLSANRDPFHATLDQKSQVKEIKKKFDISKSKSDHLTLAALYESWQYAKEFGEENTFIRKNMVSRNGIQFSSGLKKIFLNHLAEVGLINDRLYYSNEDIFEEMNVNSPDWDNPTSEATAIVLATLCTALYPNLVRIFQGSWAKSGLKSETIVPTNVDQQIVAFTKESLVSKEAKLPHPYLVYFHSMRSEERRQLIVKDASPVSSLLVLLTAPNPNITVTRIKSEDSFEEEIEKYSDEFESRDYSEDRMINIVFDNRQALSFTCSESQANLLLKWKECYFTLMQYYLSQSTRERRHHQTPPEIRDLMNRFLEEFASLLGSSNQRKE